MKFEYFDIEVEKMRILVDDYVSGVGKVIVKVGNLRIIFVKYLEEFDFKVLKKDGKYKGDVIFVKDVEVIVNYEFVYGSNV